MPIEPSEYSTELEEVSPVLEMPGSTPSKELLPGIETVHEEPTKQPKNIRDLMEQVERISVRKPPTIEAFTDLDSKFQLVKEALVIVDKYLTGEASYDAAVMHEDMLHLSAIQVSLAESVGFLQGMSRRAENARKIVKSRYALDLRQAQDKAMADGGTVRVNIPDIDNAARVLAEEQYTEASDMETVSRIMSSAWYAIRDHVNTMKATLQRWAREDS